LPEALWQVSATGEGSFETGRRRRFESFGGKTGRFERVEMDFSPVEGGAGAFLKRSRSNGERWDQALCDTERRDCRGWDF